MVGFHSSFLEQSWNASQPSSKRRAIDTVEEITQMDAQTNGPVFMGGWHENVNPPALLTSTWCN